jgi:hypothetical protein
MSSTAPWAVVGTVVDVVDVEEEDEVDDDGAADGAGPDGAPRSSERVRSGMEQPATAAAPPATAAVVRNCLRE